MIDDQELEEVHGRHQVGKTANSQTQPDDVVTGSTDLKHEKGQIRPPWSKHPRHASDEDEVEQTEEKAEESHGMVEHGLSLCRVPPSQIQGMVSQECMKRKS